MVQLQGLEEKSATGWQVVKAPFLSRERLYT
jgi:hypothetical protein